MYKYFTAKNTHTYIDVLQKLVKSYTNTYHRSIEMKPSQVAKANEAKVWDTLATTLTSMCDLNFKSASKLKSISLAHLFSQWK